MLARIGLSTCLILALATAGCGRRGALEPPPGSPVDRKSAQTAAAPTAAGAPTGLYRNTSSQTTDPAATTTKENKTVDTTPFVLDPLL